MKENLAVYEALRSSIVCCEDRIRNSTINMYVVYFAMLSFGFEYNWLFLVTFIVLITFQSMINVDRLSIEKTSCYIRVFFEERRDDIHWESLHKDTLHLLAYNSEIRNIGWYFNTSASSFLAIISFVSLLLVSVKRYTLIRMPTDVFLEIIIAFCLCVIVIYINRRNWVKRHACSQ